MFRHFKDKDIFELYYKKLFAKRLINEKSLDDNFEWLMINELKEECGIFYTKKIEKMFMDYNNS